MPTPRTSDDPDDLLQAERDIGAKLGDHELDFVSLQAISNIYRAAAAVRRRMERDLLNDAGLSWGGFTILFVLWVWDDMETATLAAECDLAKGTLTGMVTTLENQGLARRRPVRTDRRRVMVSLTESGRALIEDLFPRFNSHEAKLSVGLTNTDKKQLAALLRVVITNADSPG